MGDFGDVTSGQSAALVMLAFLQADCRAATEYQKELLSLGKDFHHLTRDINFNGPRIDTQEDGDLETDGGHLPGSITAALSDLQPSVELQWPGYHGEAADFQQIVEGLREIADQLEHNVVAQATRSLSRNIAVSPSEQWKDHLTWEVERAMRRGVGMENLPQERVIVALTLTLVKGVCEQTPRLLRNLFNTALQYLTPARAR